MPFIQCLSQLGDYGHFTDSKEFSCEGNLFADLESHSIKMGITPRRHEISSDDYVLARTWTPIHFLHLYKPLMLSLSSHGDLKSLLASFPTRLTNRYLVTRIIQCPPDPWQPGPNITTPLYSVAKPFIWYQNESVGSVCGKSRQA